MSGRLGARQVVVSAGVLALVATTLPGAGARAAELATEWRNWSHYRAIEVAPGEVDQAATTELVRLPLPEELFARASPDLDDLRILDEGDEDVGYVVFEPGAPARVEWRATELSDAGFVPGSYSQVVADTGDEPLLHNALEVTLPPGEEELFSWVEVAASPDRSAWRVVRARAPLYRFRQRGFDRSVTISYPRTRDRWLRLRLLEPRDEIRIERLRVADRVQETERLAPSLHTLRLLPESPDGESRWETTVEMPRVPIAAIEIATAQPAFHRPVAVERSDDGDVWERVGAGNVYRYEPTPGEDDSAEVRARLESLRVTIDRSAAPRWRVTIFDRDDPPIPDLAVRLLRTRRSIVFRARPGASYRLIYGNPEAEAPEYELAALTSREAVAGARRACLGEAIVSQRGVSGEPFSERHPIILWAALALVVLVLGGMALKTLRG